MAKGVANDEAPPAMKLSAGWLGAVAVWALAWPAPVAWGATPAQGFTVSPAFGEVVVRADLQVRHELTLTNREAVDQRFRLSVVDFGTLDEVGGVAFLGTPVNELEHRYGLALWLKLEQEAVMVPAGASVRLGVVVDNRPSLTPGGHYGAVLATAINDAGQPATDLRVGVKPVLSSLVLVNKLGGGEAHLSLVSQTPAEGHWWRLPRRIEHRFRNEGNVHAVPRGVVEVRDPFGRIVARGALNEASSVILPESFRRYETEVVSLGKAWLPGRYELVTRHRHDGIETTKTFTTGFWYAGALVVWLVGGLALAAVGALVWWLWIRPRRRS